MKYPVSDLWQFFCFVFAPLRPELSVLCSIRNVFAVCATQWKSLWWKEELNRIEIELFIALRAHKNLHIQRQRLSRRCFFMIHARIAAAAASTLIFSRVECLGEQYDPRLLQLSIKKRERRTWNSINVKWMLKARTQSSSHSHCDSNTPMFTPVDPPDIIHRLLPVRIILFHFFFIAHQPVASKAVCLHMADVYLGIRAMKSSSRAQWRVIKNWLHRHSHSRESWESSTRSTRMKWINRDWHDCRKMLN